MNLSPAALPAQYFFTGEVRDPHGDKLQNGSIIVQSTGLSYSTGFFGEFGITSRKQEDTLTFAFEGYEPYRTAVSAAEFMQVRLKKGTTPEETKKNCLRSLFKGSKVYGMAAGTEQSGHGPYNRLIENPFIDQPASVSFPATINRASYSMVRRMLDMGYTVPPDAVQIEEMLNYFNFWYEDPEKDDVFHCASDLLSCPWNAGHKLLCLNICARKADLQKAPSANLVFLVDVSGSMDMPNKLPMLKSGIRLLVENLRDNDKVSVMGFGGSARPLVQGIPGSEKGRILRTIEGLSADGSSPCGEGIKMAYQVAREGFIEGGNNRVVLVTDGDVTESASAQEELEDFVAEQNQGGIYLSCIGVGMGKYKRSALPVLAQKGKGDFAYVDDEQATEKALAGQLEHNLFAVADSVVITADFNPALVKEYRLIGFDNKRNLAGDTASSLESSTFGSGHSLLALFELVPLKDTLGLDTLAGIKIDYCLPGQPARKTMNYICPNNPIPFDKAGVGIRRTTCIAMFGMKLRSSGYIAGMSWMDIEKIARKNFAGKDLIDREYLALIAKARNIYARSKRNTE